MHIDTDDSKRVYIHGIQRATEFYSNRSSTQQGARSEKGSIDMNINLSDI